jgi:ribosomal protein S18 acetylase RimI-like enzyme
VIRRSTPADLPWIRELAAAAYGDLGDYGTIIPAWLEHPGVLAWIDESDDARHARRGFALLGFYQPDDDQERYIADLLALAVEPGFRRHGVGRRLLAHAIDLAHLAARDADVREMRLTVADDNAAGKRLYASAGFRAVDEDHGHYDGGQRAIRMVRPLDAAAELRPQQRP